MWQTEQTDFQMTAVVSVLLETVLRHLTLSMCGEVLSWSGEHDLRQSEAAAQKLATDGSLVLWLLQRCCLNKALSA